MDYEKLHKYTITKLQEMVNSGKITVEIARGICADFVPESDDEKIRKWLICTLKSLNNSPVQIDGAYEMMLPAIAWLEKQAERKTPQWMIDFLDNYRRKIGCSLDHDEARDVDGKILCIMQWLEKQGEHAKFYDSIQVGDKVTRNQDGVLVNLSQLERVAKPSDKVEPKFKVGQTIKKKGFNLGFIIVKIEDGFYYNDMGDHFPFTDQDNWELVEQKPVNRLKTTAGNWYVCDMEVMNENMTTAFHRGEVYYCPKDGYIDVNGALFEVGTLDVFRLATKEEIPLKETIV